jgi:Holliday junction DNA helicase RuvA
MISHLRGSLLDRSGSVVIVDCRGVGYEVTVSAYTLATLGVLGSEVSLRVYTQFTDNKISLYGFAMIEERELFDLLITVKNVGPSSAIKILSAGAGPVEIANMITSEQVGALKSIKGVGKKTAELLVVELRDKCESLLATWGANGSAIASAAEVAYTARASNRLPILDDVSSALVQLGWRTGEVDKVVAALTVSNEATIESLLREALRAMPR